MKKILLSMMVMFALVSANKAKAQVEGCTGGASNCALAVANETVLITQQNCNFGGNPNKTEIVFDVEFDLTYNSGNKYIYIHSWFATDYPGYFPCGGGAQGAPTAANAALGTFIDELNKSFLDIGLDNTVARGAVGVPVNVPILTTYPADNSVILISPSNSPGMTCTKTFISGSTDHVKLSNVRIVVNAPCGASVTVKTDVWSANAASGTVSQCWVAGITQSFNDPSISLLKVCASSPYKYDIGLQGSGGTTLNVTYKLYAHDPLLGTDPHPSDPLIYTSPVIILDAGNSYLFDPAPIDLPAPYCCTDPWSQWDIYVKVTAAEFANEISTPLISAQCATLPVNLKYFTASRSRDLVTLKWETAQETDSKGFDVQRKVGNAGWTTIDFVASKAPGGNSNTTLSYEFVDYNNTKGITQYRLRQLDFDGTQAYSQIRSVRGEAQKGKTIVYPNPSGDGKVNIIFEDVRTTRDVQVIDMSGRTIKQWKALTNNNITIDNLNAGFYTVRIVDTETGEQVIEKFVVNKR